MADENVSSKADRLQVSLFIPHNGWIEIAVTTEEEFKQAVSYTPNDFMDELVMAACLLMEGQEGLAVASCEPSGYEFRFCKEPDTGMSRLSVVGFPDVQRRKGEGTTILTYRASAAQVVLPFWRALRNLEARVTAIDYREAMRREFPSAGLERLSQLLSK